MIVQSAVKQSTQQQRQFWQSHLEKWRNSGMGQTEYCRQNHLAKPRFTYWKNKLSKSDFPVEFVEVSPESIPEAPAIFNNNGTPLRLNVGSRFVIEIPDGFSPATLEKILQTLKEV
jgi:hypothetical protein